MYVALIHLSDVHVRNASDKILDKASSIASMINATPHQVELCVVIISGDLAYSGKVREYDLSKAFISQLGDCLDAAHNVTEHRIVMVPGNHDCDFEREEDMRKMMLPMIARNPNKAYDKSVVNSCTAVQQNFFATMASVEGLAQQVDLARLFYTREFALSTGATIRFY